MTRGPPRVWIRAIVVVIVLWAGAPAWGQTSVQTPEIPDNLQEDKAVSGNLTGVFGGMMVGAELVMATEGILRFKSPWAYVVGGVLGGGAGAIGGYYVEKHSTAGAVTLLVGGMALAVPTMLMVAWGRSFHFDDALDSEVIRVEELHFDSGLPRDGAAVRAPQRSDRQYARRSVVGPLLSYDAARRSMSWQVPAPQISMSAVSREEWVLGFRPVMALNIPLFAVDL